MKTQVERGWLAHDPTVRRSQARDKILLQSSTGLSPVFPGIKGTWLEPEISHFILVLEQRSFWKQESLKEEKNGCFWVFALF